MPESLETVLRMVEEGSISAEEAARLLAALDASAGSEPSGGVAGDASARAPDAGSPGAGPSGSSASGPGRWVKVEVTDGGRTVVNLKLPTSLGEVAMSRIPGLAEEDLARIREAVRTGLRGDILRVLDENGSGVRIVVE